MSVLSISFVATAAGCAALTSFIITGQPNLAQAKNLNLCHQTSSSGNFGCGCSFRGQMQGTGSQHSKTGHGGGCTGGVVLVDRAGALTRAGKAFQLPPAKTRPVVETETEHEHHDHEHEADGERENGSDGGKGSESN